MNNQKIENTVERRFWKKFFLVCLAISFFLVLALRVSFNTILDFLLLWFVIASFVFAFGFGVIMQWKEWIDKNKPQLEYDYVFQIANRYCCEDIEKAYIMDRIHRLHLNEIKTSIKQIKLENKLDVDFFVDDEEGIVKFEDAQNKFDQIMHILKDDRNKITYLNLDDFGTHEIERLSDLLTQQNNKFEGIEFTKWLDLEDEENLEEKRLEEKRSELEKKSEIIFHVLTHQNNNIKNLKIRCSCYYKDSIIGWSYILKPLILIFKALTYKNNKVTQINLSGIDFNHILENKVMKILYKTLTHKNNKIKKLKLSGSFFAGKLIDIKYIAKALMHKNNKLKCLDLSGSGFDIDPLIYALIHENNKLEFLNLSFNFLWREFSYLSFEKLMLIFKALRHRNNKIRYIIMGPFEFNKDNEYLKDEIKKEINKTLNVLERRHRKIALRLIHFKI